MQHKVSAGPPFYFQPILATTGFPTAKEREKSTKFESQGNQKVFGLFRFRALFARFRGRDQIPGSRSIFGFRNEGVRSCPTF